MLAYLESGQCGKTMSNRTKKNE